MHEFNNKSYIYKYLKLEKKMSVNYLANLVVKNLLMLLMLDALNIV
jgi:hypothetical protein